MKRQGKAPFLSVWSPAAALSLLSSSALSSAQAINSVLKNLRRVGQISAITTGHFSVVIYKPRIL
jgi:hypothetical protein